MKPPNKIYLKKTIGCPDSWVTEVPIHPPAQKIQKPATPPTSCAPQLVSSPKCLESISAQSQNVLKKPFKSISAELGFAQPLNLVDTLGLKPRDSDAMSRGKRPASVSWKNWEFIGLLKTNSGSKRII